MPPFEVAFFLCPLVGDASIRIPDGQHRSVVYQLRQLARREPAQTVYRDPSRTGPIGDSPG